MANPVVVDFLVNGIPNVRAAMKTVEQATATAEKAMTITAQREAANRTRIAEREATARAKSTGRAVAADKAAQMLISREREKDAAGRLRAAERGAQAEVRAEERKNQALSRAAERRYREVERFADRAVREDERRAGQWVRREERKRFIQQRDEYRNRRHFAEGIAGAVGHGVARGASRVIGMASHVGNMVGQLGGGFSIDASVERAAKNSGDLEDVLNAAQNPTSNFASNRKRREASDVLPAIQGTATRWGLKREDVQGGLRAFTGATGDMETALKLLPQLGEMARATGTDFHTLMDAAGGVGHVLDNVTDSGEKAEIIMRTMRTGAGQGKAGSFELKDQAAVMSKIVAAAGKFDGKADDVIPELMAIAQSARSGGGAWNAASAATAVTALAGTFGKGARLEAFKAQGIDVFTDKSENTVRRPSEIIADAVDKTGGSIPKLTALFGSVMSLRAVNKMGTLYKEAEEGKVVKDGKKLGGKEAILDYYKTMTKDAGMSKGDVSDAAERRMSTLDAQMAQQREKFDQAVQEKVIPALLALVPVIEDVSNRFVDINAEALPAFVDLIKTVADFAGANKELIRDIARHPIGAIMAAEVSKSLAQSLIGEGVKGIISRAFADAGMGTIFQSTFSKAMAGGMIFATAALAIQQGIITIDQEYKDADKLREKGAGDASEAAGIAARLRNGTATDDDRKRARDVAAKLTNDVRDSEDQTNNPSLVRRAGGAAASLVAPDAVKEEAAQQRRQTDLLIKSLAELKDAIKVGNGAGPGGQPDSRGAPGPRSQGIVNNK